MQVSQRISLQIRSGLIPLLLALAAIILWAHPPQVARADVFAVTKTADTNDGACDADCSLREAIIAANALPGSDTITVLAGTYTLGIAGTGEDASATGDLDITDDVVINGAGAAQTIIDGGAIDRVFHIHTGVVVEINDVTVQNGNAPFEGGGIFNDSNATLTIINSTISGNSAASRGEASSTLAQ